MSLTLQAPLPTITTTTILPTPAFNDSEALRHSVNVHRSMNNTKRSYVKTNVRSVLTYDFTLSRMKALELRAFVIAYNRAKVRLKNHLGEVWEVYFTSNPFEFETAGKAGGWPGEEFVTVTLQVEGTLVTSVEPESC